MNHKRGARLMVEDNLLCLRKRSFVAATDSGHDLRVWLNLAAVRGAPFAGGNTAS